MLGIDKPGGEVLNMLYNIQSGPVAVDYLNQLISSLTGLYNSSRIPSSTDVIVFPRWMPGETQ